MGRDFWTQQFSGAGLKEYYYTRSFKRSFHDLSESAYSCTALPCLDDARDCSDDRTFFSAEPFCRTVPWKKRHREWLNQGDSTLCSPLLFRIFGSNQSDPRFWNPFIKGRGGRRGRRGEGTIGKTNYSPELDISAEGKLANWYHVR